MAQQSSSSPDLSFLMILLLVAYVMCSAPKYVRHLRNTKHDIRTEAVTPLKMLMKAGQVYGLNPYKKMWSALTNRNPDGEFLTQQLSKK